MKRLSTQRVAGILRAAGFAAAKDPAGWIVRPGYSLRQARGGVWVYPEAPLDAFRDYTTGLVALSGRMEDALGWAGIETIHREGASPEVFFARSRR